MLKKLIKLNVLTNYLMPETIVSYIACTVVFIYLRNIYCNNYFSFFKIYNARCNCNYIVLTYTL